MRDTSVTDGERPKGRYTADSLLNGIDIMMEELNEAGR